MPNLLCELELYLHRWQDNLSAAWREGLDGVGPDFDAVPRDASLDQDAQIVPVRRGQSGVFYALEGIDPCDVGVVVIGNDPYPDPCRATGRSFEQGNLTAWIDDLEEPGRVTPSLLSLVCAAAALLPNAEGLGLDRARLDNRREILWCGLRNGQVVLPPPRSMFESLTGQGVLWINRTPTISVVCDAGRRRQGSPWQAIERQRKLHRALWRPVTNAIVSLLVQEAATRPVVFALFGGQAKNLQGWIEAHGRYRHVPGENLRFVKSGHPSKPRYFFCSGNPLGRINDELTDPIDWCGPTTGRTGVNHSTHLSTAPQRTRGRAGTPTVRTSDRLAAGASAHSAVIMARTVGKYRTTLRQLAER